MKSRQCAITQQDMSSLMLARFFVVFFINQSLFSISFSQYYNVRHRFFFGNFYENTTYKFLLTLYTRSNNNFANLKTVYHRSNNYVEQTGRTIDFRLKEHKRATNNRQYYLSAVADHAFNNPTSSTSTLFKFSTRPIHIFHDSSKSIEITKRPTTSTVKTWKRLIKDSRHRSRTQTH